MRFHRWMGWLGLLAIIGAALFYGFRPTSILVETASVTRAPLRVSVTEEGKTRVIDRYVISAPVPGFLRRIDLNVGDTVERDHVVAMLEPLRSNVLDPRSRAEATARAAAAEAALLGAQQNAKAAQADADVAAASLKRSKDLYAAKNISLERYDEAVARGQMTQAALRSAEFAVDVARYEVEAARTALQYSAADENNVSDETVSVKATVSGSVLNVYRESEGVVNAGEPLMEIGDPTGLEIAVDVLSADAVRIAPGTRVLIQNWGGDGVLDGEVRTVEPVGFTKISALGVEEQRVLVIIDITSPRETWRKLGDGYRVEAEFILWEQDDVLQIPASALFRQNNGWAVFVVNKDSAQVREIELGQRGGFAVEVASGLDENDRVIIHPGDTIEQGSRIETR